MKPDIEQYRRRGGNSRHLPLVRETLNQETNYDALKQSIQT